MRDYAKIVPTFWTDHRGQQWPVILSSRRLKFKYPAHAALRAHVFHRDGYRCVRCGAQGIDLPIEFTGRDTLFTNTLARSGRPDVLVLDHVLTLPAGGRSTIENLQTLCDTCNKRKQPEDKAAVMAQRASQ